MTTLDVVRAARFLSEVSGKETNETVVTVVGGHSGATIVPLLSQAEHGFGVKGETYEKLVHRIQFGGDEVVKAKDGAGSATLSMAYAGARFANALLRGLKGEEGVVTPTFIKSPLFEDQGVEYFSSNVELGVRVFTILFIRSQTDVYSSHSPTVLRRSTTSARSALRRRSSSLLAFPNSRRTLRRVSSSSRRLRGLHRGRCV